MALAAVAMSTTVACREAKETADERSCAATQALTSTHYKGESLPPKTLALTFDDGPGVRTPELSKWLADRGVRATFFVNGKMLRGAGGPAVLAGLVADGHVLGNHTESHSNLTTLAASAVVSEVETTDALIAPYVKGQFIFRPPYNAFDVNVFNALSSSTMSKYVGPIDWDIGDSMGPQQATDWDCWQPIGTSDPPVLDVKTCGDLFLAEIRAKQKGIVLLHDPYFIDDDPTKGGTVDMVKEIVPVLLAEGYRFVTVDEVPAIASALPPKTMSSGDAGVEGSTTPAPTAAPSTTTTPPSPPPTITTAPPPCR